MQPAAVGLQQMQAEDRVVNVVVARRAVDVPARALRPAIAEREALRLEVEGKDVVGERIGIGDLEVVAYAPTVQWSPSSTGLPRLQPATRPNQAACTWSW